MRLTPQHHVMIATLKQELADVKLGDHICSIYEKTGEQLAVAVPFIIDGLARGERCIYVVDDSSVEDVVQALAEAGVDVARERRRGALRILTRLDTCLQTGKFVPQEMVDFIRQAEAEALADGFSGLRQMGEMTWVLGPEPGCDRLIEFEALVDRSFINSKTVGLCHYNRSRFDATCLYDVFRTHPLIILGDQVYPNPYYELPEMVLDNGHAATTAELKAKRADWWIAQLQRVRTAEQERERALEKLKQSERRLAEAQKVAHVGSWERDLRTNEVTWSEELYRLFGLQANEVDLSYQQFLNLVLPQDVDRIRVLVEEAIRQRRSFNFDYRITLPDGSVRVLNDRGNVILNEEGEPIRLVGTCQDVTEFRQAEQESKRQKVILQTIFDHIPVMIAFVDAAGRLQMVNRHWERVLGWSLEEAQSSDLLRECYPDPEYRARVIEYTLHPTPGWTDFKVRVRDGRTLEISWALIVLPDGTRIGFGQDITERRQAEQALQEYAARHQTLSRRLLEVQEEERRRLARELHDEIGQMLTGLRMLFKPNGGLSTEAVNTKVDQARGIIAELLEKVRGLSFDLRPAALDQLGLVPALLTLFESYTARTEVLVDFKHNGMERRFATDAETAAYRIVQEALTNVARHAGVASVIVRVWASADLLSVQIEDRGRGFKPQAALATVRSSGLVGMQERVMLQGGHLTIESRPGAGTQITAELPLRPTIPEDQR